MKEIIRKLATLISAKTSYHITIIRKGYGNVLGHTAVKAADGFWYVGNVFDSQDIAYGIASNGKVEEDEHALVTTILKTLLRSSDIAVYDIGANTGYYGMLAANLDKERVQTYSFEPLPQHTSCIRENIRINGFEKSSVFEFALGEKDEEKTFYTAGSGSTFDPSFIGGSPEEQVSVKIRRLDEVVTAENLQKPDFIKIDVEGHELQVLKGATSTIKASLPVLFIEVVQTLKSIGRSYVNKEFLNTFSLLEEMGYETFTSDGGGVTKFDPQQKIDGVRMYLFLHKNHSEIKKALHL